MEPLTITDRHTKRLVSIPVNHVIAIEEGSDGARVYCGPRTVDAVESYSDVFCMYSELTGTNL